MNAGVEWKVLATEVASCHWAFMPDGFTSAPDTVFCLKGGVVSTDAVSTETRYTLLRIEAFSREVTVFSYDVLSFIAYNGFFIAARVSIKLLMYMLYVNVYDARFI